MTQPRYEVQASSNQLHYEFISVGHNQAKMTYFLKKQNKYARYNRTKDGNAS